MAPFSKVVFFTTMLLLGSKGGLRVADAAECPEVLDELRLQLMWVSQPQFAGFEIPNSQDTRLPSYKDECLSVKVQPGGTGWTPLEELSTGRVDIALTDGFEAVKQYMGGMNLTIIHHTFRKNPYRLASFKSTKNLAGAKVGRWCCGLDFSTKTMVALESANVTFVDQGFTMEPLFSEQVDVASAMIYNEVGRVMQQMNPATNFLYQYSELQIWNPNDYPIPELHQVVVVDSRRLAELRPRLVRFLKVVNKAWIACRDQEEFCVKNYPSNDQAHVAYMMREINRLNFPSQLGLGVLPTAEYNRAMDFAVQLGFVSSPPPYDEVADMSLLQELDQDPSVMEPFDRPPVRFCAPYGSNDYGVCKGFEHTLCPAGSQPSGPDDGNCTSCPPGRFSYEPGSLLDPPAARMLVCQDCPPGKFIPGFGATACELCAAGNFSPEGQVECTACPSGRSTEQSRGSPGCSDCALGRFAGANGSAECTLCDKGKYQDQKEAVMCKSCATGMTTEVLGAGRQDQCICKSGSRSQGGKCIACSQGMICEEGAAEVVIEKGYYSGLELEVFRCFGNENRCPGGRPGETCSSGRTGISCAECFAGWAAKASGECKPCTGANYVPIVIVTLVGLALLIFIYYKIDTQDYAKQGHTALLLAMTVSLLITLLQQLSVISLFALEWPEPLRSAMRALSFFSLDLEVLELACITGTSSAMGNFTVKLILMALWFGLLVVVHFVFVIAFYKRKFTERMASLTCGVGMLFLVVYISIVATVISPLRCLQNPNQLSTVHEYQSVICWKAAEHTSMVVVGLIAILAPLSFLGWCCAIVWTFPARMRQGNAVYLRRYAFLFARFRPDVFWYSLVHIMRSLLFALASIIPNVVGQIVLFQLVMCSSTVLTSLLYPWRVRFANMLEIAMTVAITVLLSIAAFFVENEPLEPLAWVATVIVFGLVLALFPLIGFLAYKHFTMRGRKPFSHFICHHKSGAGSFARLLKMCLLASPKVKKKVFIDSDDLTDLELIFDYVGSQTDMLVILCSKDIFTRPWCMGEMVFAMRCQVPAVRVAFPDFSPLDEVFIEGYEQYVPDVACLASRGLGVRDVQDALLWAQMLPVKGLPTQLSHHVTERLVAGLTEDVLGTSSIPPAKCESVLEAKVVVVADQSSMEAVATAMILSRMLRPHLVNCPQEIPVVLADSEELSATVTKVIFLLTSGVFGSAGFLRALLAAARLGTKYLLVISDDSFRFPTAQTLSESKAVAATVTDDPHSLFDIVHQLFSTIAIVFQPELYSSTVTVLETKAIEIHGRLIESKSKLKSITCEDNVYDI